MPITCLSATSLNFFSRCRCCVPYYKCSTAVFKSIGAGDAKGGMPRPATTVLNLIEALSALSLIDFPVRIPGHHPPLARKALVCDIPAKYAFVVLATSVLDPCL